MKKNGKNQVCKSICGDEQRTLIGIFFRPHTAAEGGKMQLDNTILGCRQDNINVLTPPPKQVCGRKKVGLSIPPFYYKFE